MESLLHGLLKEAAIRELGNEGYELYVEPPEPPLERLSWDTYRPDVLGLISDDSELRLALVECETSPRLTRMKEKASKIMRGLSLRKRLNESHLFRLLVIIPCGMLDRVTYREGAKALGDMGRRPKG